MLWCKHNLFKNFFYFQNEASTTPETKIFSKLDLLFMKSHLPFDLRLPKNWWSLLENLWMGHLLEIWWSGSKDLFSQFGLTKRWHVSKVFFSEKMNFLKIKHFKKIHFLVPEYGNLTGVKTHRDRLESSGEGFLERGVQIFGFGEGKGPHRGFGCRPVVAFHFSVCSAHESSKSFSFLL